MFAGFYYVDSNYIEFLQNAERLHHNGITHVPNVDYANRRKFLNGVVYETEGKIKYFVPVSHYSKNKENNIVIKIHEYGKEVIAASLRFNFMIPVPEKCLIPLDFKDNSQFQSNYERIKIQKDYLYIKKKVKMKNIQKIAKQTYDSVINNKDKNLVKNSCDFPLLELAYKKFIKE